MPKITLADIQKSRLRTIKNCISSLINTQARTGGFLLNSNSKVIVDGAVRDRAIWAADLYVAGPFLHANIAGGDEIWRNSLLAISGKQYTSGKLPACVTLNLHYRFLSPFFDTYGMWWLLSADEYIQKTKDKNFKVYFESVLKKCLDYHQKKMPDRLYRTSFLDLYSNWTIFRPRVNALANCLYYQVVKVSKKYGVKVSFDEGDFKEKYIQLFWDQNKGLIRDGKAYFLDANAMTCVSGILDKKMTTKLIKNISKFETKYGPKEVLGSSFGLTNYHKYSVSPFAAYLYAKALIKRGLARKAKEVVKITLTAGLAISQKYGLFTLPEFWKDDGSLGARAVTRGFLKYGRSMCHSWSVFGATKI